MNRLKSRYRELAIIALGVGGAFLILAGVFLLVDTTPVNAALPDIPAAAPPAQQLPDDAEFVGMRDCITCHRDLGRAHMESRHGITLREADSDAILADFEQGEDVRMVTFPEEDEPRAFTEDDIEYVVGSGRYIQRYLYEVERDVYAVLPAEWNVVEQAWQPYTLAETWPDPAYDWGQNCAGCHTTGLSIDDDEIEWEDEGVQCESCHGPGSIHTELADDAGKEPSAEELAEIRAAIVLSPDAQICGQCHSQGTSAETGQPYPIGYRAGDTLLTEETYTLVAPDDSAHWRASGHAASANMQYNEWAISGHATSLDSVKASEYADDSCLSCHSADATWNERLSAAVEAGERLGEPPEAATLETAQYGVTCATCHNVHNETGNDFLLVSEPKALCESCHSDSNLEDFVHHPSKEMYEGIAVVDVVSPSPSNHFTVGAECTTCHMPTSVQSGNTWHSFSHTMSPALPGSTVEGQPDSCTSCHDDLTQEYMQQFIEDTQGGVLERLTNLQVALGSNPDAEAWVKTAVDFIVGDGSAGIHNYAYTTSLLAQSEFALGLTQAGDVPASAAVRPVENPTECAECHEAEFRIWQTSPHANASLNENFLQMYAADGRPNYCMSCHASGYDPRTQEYEFEGVVCSNCHFVTSDAPHPPGPVEVADASEVCGTCHSGAHAPTYDEWLVSSHSTAGIDCADCHTPHDNGLVLEDVNTTCGSCHEEALVDEIHMGEDMNCVDCHMSRRVSENGVQMVQTGHTMGIDPAICANCHGNTHLLSSGGPRLSDEEASQVALLEKEVMQLQTTASQNLNSGIVGGAIGALVLVIVVFVVIRLGRIR